MEDILRQLKENPDVLPVVSLPPAKPTADSSSPNRSDTATTAASISSVGSLESVESKYPPGSTADIPQSAAATSAVPAVIPVAVPVVASAIPFAVGSHLYQHSRSASLDGSDVCHTGPSDSAVSAVSAALATIQSQTTTIPTTTTLPPTNNLAPLSISNPGVAVTVDGATPPVVAIPAPQFPTVASSQPTPPNPADAAPPTAPISVGGLVESTEPVTPKVFNSLVCRLMSLKLFFSFLLYRSSYLLCSLSLSNL